MREIIIFIILIIFMILSVYLFLKIRHLEKHIDDIYKDLNEVCE